MNGGDLHYHLSQHGTFFENEIRFYACEVILGLEHMHTRGIVYRDLKVVSDNSNKYNINRAFRFAIRIDSPICFG